MSKWNVVDEFGMNPKVIEAPTAAEAQDEYKRLRVAGLPQAAPRTTWGGVGKAIGSGLVRAGAGFAGMPGDIADLTRQAPRLIGRPAIEPGLISELPGSEDFIKWFERDVTPLYEGRTTLERGIGKVAEYAPGVVSGPGSLTRRVIQQVAAPATGEEVAGELAETYAPEYEGVARLIGSVGGSTAAAPAVIHAVTPNPANPRRIMRADQLRNAGVEHISAGQEVGNVRLMAAESELGEGGAAGLNDRTAEEFTRAVSRPFGEDAPYIDEHVLNNAHARIGGVMDELETRYTLDPQDRQIITDFQDTWGFYRRALGDNARAPVVEESIRDMVALITEARATGRPIPGDVYKARRSQITADARDISQPETKRALLEIRDALDEAMERSMTARAVNVPQAVRDVERWREARRQYANLMIAEDAVTRGRAEARGMGTVSPVALEGAASAGPRRKNFIRGRSDYTTLARAGNAVLTPFPQSGTTTRGWASNLVPAAVGGLALGGGGGLASQDMLTGLSGAAAGAGLTVLGTAAAGRTLMNPTVQRYLRNQLMGGEPGWGPVRQGSLTAAVYGPRIMAPLIAEDEDERPVKESFLDLPEPDLSPRRASSGPGNPLRIYLSGGPERDRLLGRTG